MKIVKKRPLVILTTTVKLFFGELQFKSLLKSRNGTETDVFVNIETNTYPMYQFHFWMLQVKLPVRCGGKKTLIKQSQSSIFVINTVNKLPFLWQNSLGIQNKYIQCVQCVHKKINNNRKQHWSILPLQHT